MRKINKRLIVLGLLCMFINIFSLSTHAHTLQDEQEAAQKVGISMQQVDALIDRGYILSEIENMSISEVDAILTRGLSPIEIMAYYNAKNIVQCATASAPAGYTKVANVPDGGGTGALLEGQYVSVGQYLGNQNTADGHVHLQICTHDECTAVHSGRNLDLTCVRPDLYI